MDPLKEEVEALKEKIREMDTDISYYKTKLNESKDNVVEQKLTASMYLLAYFFQYYFIFTVNCSQIILKKNHLILQQLVILSSSTH